MFARRKAYIGYFAVSGLTFVALMLMAAYSAIDARGEIAPRAKPSEFEPQVEFDRPVVLEGEDGPLYLRLHFDVPESLRPAHERPPVNLALVIDRSGSMDDRGKMDYAKRAANLIVDRLSPSDRLAVVEYDDQVTVLWPASKVEAKGLIQRQIDALYPRGNTNLTGGMMKGVSQIRSFSHDERALTRVILLSDGLANEGVTDPGQIRSLVRESRGSGVRITTLGLGIDYNEDLMQDIAENGGGAYYYVEHPNQLARIFEKELDTMFLTAAKDCVIRIEVEPGVRGLDVYGVTSTLDDGETTIPLEDLYAGENRSLMVKLDIDEQKQGTVKLGTVRFSYLDVATGKHREVTSDLTVTVSRSRELVEKSKNEQVTVDAKLADAERRQKDALELFEAGEYDEAQKVMNDLAGSLSADNVVMQDARIANKIEAISVENEQMELGAAAPEVAADFAKASKQRIYQASRGKRSLYMLQRGDQGYEVEVLQQALSSKGYYSGPIDGTFDDDVAQALESYQTDNKLDADGVAGPKTMNSMGVY